MYSTYSMMFIRQSNFKKSQRPAVFFLIVILQINYDISLRQGGSCPGLTRLGQNPYVQNES